MDGTTLHTMHSTTKTPLRARSRHGTCGAGRKPASGSLRECALKPATAANSGCKTAWSLPAIALQVGAGAATSGSLHKRATKPRGLLALPPEPAASYQEGRDEGHHDDAGNARDDGRLEARRAQLTGCQVHACRRQVVCVDRAVRWRRLHSCRGLGACACESRVAWCKVNGWQLAGAHLQSRTRWACPPRQRPR